ncbi:skeletal muscle and kidney-enriched inositol phosphatase [Magnaporthiopsis poae ATCC 64411]|uniref:Skeletal muscle and kidney-enriched inositol phosphatase n=1 Tax=Magnaporthiopsis poae (strain ATCC 64411 / 73-15) TaxID=644358 RepID=A0A0C4E5H5_MAGP6|nr:skeletal muscle and kidney-enriched inositol phosphatase [Magnaporthiopsis poae ATCC 64411]
MSSRPPCTSSPHSRRPEGGRYPSTPATPTRPFKIPSSTPHTPVLEPRRSPRLVPSQPPSPPPPRRSAELKRERERERDRDARPVPPPINRADKPLIPARTSHLGPDTSLNSPDHTRRYVEPKSPFGSPPSSNGSVDGDAPPTLPARPKPPAMATADDIPRRGSAPQLEFEPPPLHPSIASRRKEREHEMANGAALRAVGDASASRGPLTPQGTGDQAPPLPARPGAPPLQEQKQTAAAHNGYSVMRPPPRPPKPGTNDHQIPSGTGTHMRAVSTPHPPPPQRVHGRATTLDRSSSLRAPPPPPPTMPAVSENRAPEGTASSGARTEINLAYPDSSNTNRRPPFIKQGIHEINTKYDSRIFDVCGELVCTSGHLTRVWSVLDGELLMSLSHGENVKATAVAFRPGANVDEEGARVWIGNNVGELMEADIATQSIVASKPTAHGRHEIIKIYRHFNELWTLDEAGTLNVWGPDEETGVPNMAGSPHQAFRCPKGHTFSIVVGDELWHATGKEVRVFLPTMDGKTQFQVLIRALYQDQAGEVVSGTLMPSNPDKVFLGHGDGKVSVYSKADYSCLGLFNIGSFKVNTLAGVGDYIWAGFNSGRLCVYDITQSPWVVKKDWQAHDNPVVKIISDRSSFWKTERSQVISLGADSAIRAWDGLLQDDWLEGEMQARDGEYCEMEELKAMIMTWNAGASTPNSLRYSESDATFIQNLLQSSDSPDILVFGFQELVDLEDKTATAKRFLKTKKKKEGSDQERMSHQYRDWRDFLVRSLDDYMPGELYHLLQTAHMVGLFTCIFVKADIRGRIRNLSAAEVKRGMGGLHGNKGAIVVRFTVDDTSLCFVNCHLAAGQTQAQSRHNDIHAILEAAILPVERDPNTRIDSFIGGGDGTMVLDHELCLINGDLNYRIDTIARGRITQLDYRRHEVRVSDHRPVSGRFRFSVKRIEPRARAVAWMECQQRFEDTKAQVAMEEKLYYLMQIIGYDEATSRQLIAERSSRRVHRSPSRNRG